mmetsp:Transcript_125355/g.360124  ORF Transcript_125355/g.360124 Transcript_125355/m.360124 type:complete len:85 (-) Transcript_125355:18-272(-)
MAPARRARLRATLAQTPNTHLPPQLLMERVFLNKAGRVAGLSWSAAPPLTASASKAPARRRRLVQRVRRRLKEEAYDAAMQMVL